ncbi:MAG TPA: PIN domain-containing protein [Roseiarcus sp.]|nr:PIN domain-containing protein [Roseiarcus sp.]
MQSQLHRLRDILDSQNATAVALDPADCLMAGEMAWPRRDPFDRFLAASALRRKMPIVSADAAFDGVVTRIW